MYTLPSPFFKATLKLLTYITTTPNLYFHSTYPSKLPNNKHIQSHRQAIFAIRQGVGIQGPSPNTFRREVFQDHVDEFRFEFTQQIAATQHLVQRRKVMELRSLHSSNTHCWGPSFFSKLRYCRG
ncbi:hypothetical protein E2C01_018404 [Portunus trituberculatus]|uniref:Uncharacterized protein n=1 Tax=Portunus trituberculatus TaxID=210409 RepID=A0A5B7DV26_PORTR|nr:hypothetical protein [Portunus trituberculatus]